jgi:hypothetical protein
MIEEEAKAVKEIAKTTGKAIDAGRETGKFMAKFIKGPLEQAMGIFADKLKYMRWERQISFIDKTNEILKERGLSEPTQPVAMKSFIPLVHAAILEEDDLLQEIWANLLVNAGDKDSGVEVRRNFITILQDLSFIEVQILEKIYSIELGLVEEIWTCELPEKVLTERPEDENKRPTEDVALSLANLCRLNLLESVITMGVGGTSLKAVYQTVLGRKLYEACTKKPGRSAGS